MSKKLLPNRISKDLPPDAREKARAAFQVLMDLLGDDTPISDEEYKRLEIIADTKKRIADDKYAIMLNNPEMVEAPPLEEVTKDKNYYEFGDFLRTLKKQFETRLNKEQNIAGAEYFNGTSFFEKTVKHRVAKQEKGAANVLAQLLAVVGFRTNSPAKAAAPPTNPPLPPSN